MSLKAAPAHLTLKTYAVLNDMLNRHRPFRILLSWYNGQWQHELICGHVEACRRLLKLKTQLGSQCSKRQIEQRRAVSELGHNDPFRKLLELWRTSAQNIDARRDHDTLASCIDARYAIVHADTNTAKLFFHQIGEGIILYDKSWRQLASGSRVEDQPDYEYAKWLAGVIRN